jgi:NADPH:quinone reductase-like Zn-dependent oxidoreductase
MIRLTLNAIGGAMADAVGLESGRDPVPGPGELLVAAEAAPINPGDFLLAAGLYSFRPRGRSRWAPRASDRLVVSAHNVVPVGDGADALQLAMLVNAASAHVLLTRYADLKPDDWVGLTLGNSAVGQNVIALVRHAGLRTLVVVRREAAAPQLHALGADLVRVTARTSAIGPPPNSVTGYGCSSTASAAPGRERWSARSAAAAPSSRSPP